MTKKEMIKVKRNDFWKAIGSFLGFICLTAAAYFYADYFMIGQIATYSRIVELINKIFNIIIDAVIALIFLVIVGGGLFFICHCICCVTEYISIKNKLKKGQFLTEEEKRKIENENKIKLEIEKIEKIAKMQKKYNFLTAADLKKDDLVIASEEKEISQLKIKLAELEKNMN